MKKTTKVLMAVIVITTIFVGCGKSSNDTGAKGDSTAAASNKGERKVLYWYDPMSPTIHFDHPGKSPTMDMDLVPKYDGEDEDNPNIIKVDPAMVQNIGVVTAPVEHRKLTRTINTYGVVAPDERSISDINTRVGGWIEQLYFDYTGMDVRKGQPMAVIYSPDLIAAEQEFLQMVSFSQVGGDSASRSRSLISSARERLGFFGMSGNEIDELQRTGKVIDRVVIHSPEDGVILEKDIFTGQKISSGQTLFRVADLRHIWILADVFKMDMPFLKFGSPATVSYSQDASENNSQSYAAMVDFIFPEVDATARTVKARISLNNPGMKMKVGQYVNVAIHSQVSYSAIAVPSQAVVNTGLRQVVAVALGNGKFEIRPVRLGVYADGYYEITEGLTEGETIVISGQFLIDSDANLKSAGASLMPDAQDKSDTTSIRSEKNGIKNMPDMHINRPSPKKKLAGGTKDVSMDMNMLGMDMSGKKGSVKPQSDTTGQER